MLSIQMMISYYRCIKPFGRTKIEDLKNIKLNALPVYDVRNIKIKTNFRNLNVTNDGVDFDHF